MKNHNYSESDIQKYILDELTLEEKVKFEATMNENPDFALEVNYHQKIAEGIADFGAQEFKARAQEIYAEVRPEIISKTKSTKSNISVFKVGLAALVILLLSFLLYQYTMVSSNVTPQEIYTQNYTSYSWNPSLRNDDTNMDLGTAVNLYGSKSYDDAIPLIEDLLIENPDNIQARLAIACAYLENDKPELSIPQLKHILTLDDVLYQDQANWYLGLSYLKLNQLEKAKSIFAELASKPDADYYLEAREVLQQLN